jgi:hypothetical protein
MQLPGRPAQLQSGEPANGSPKKVAASLWGMKVCGLNYSMSSILWLLFPADIDPVSNDNSPMWLEKAA